MCSQQSHLPQLHPTTSDGILNRTMNPNTYKTPNLQIPTITLQLPKRTRSVPVHHHSLLTSNLRIPRPKNTPRNPRSLSIYITSSLQPKRLNILLKNPLPQRAIRWFAVMLARCQCGFRSHGVHERSGFLGNADAVDLAWFEA